MSAPHTGYLYKAKLDTAQHGEAELGLQAFLSPRHSWGSAGILPLLGRASCLQWCDIWNTNHTAGRSHTQA